MRLSLLTIFAARKSSCKTMDVESRLISMVHSAKSPVFLPQIHAQIIRHSLISSSIVVTQLISSCFVHKSVDYGLSIFRYFDDKNLFIFNALVRGLTENCRYESAVRSFLDMLRLNVKPDRLTFPFVLKSVAGLGFSVLGRGIHGGVVKFGVELDTFVMVCLVDMYAKVDGIRDAYQVFVESPEKVKNGSILLWNVLINGYCKAGDMDGAVVLFERMPERNVGSWNSLINGLAKVGNIERAKELFDRMPERNVVSWTTMINGFLQKGTHKEALTLFSVMLKEDVEPNEITFVCALSSCEKIGALDTGACVHQCLLKRGLCRNNRAVRNALLDMYAKCGDMASTSKLFAEVGERDLLTWSIMIWALAFHGFFEDALDCFEQMKSTGTKPDGTILLAMLAACSHSGQVEWGLKLFNGMQHEYSVEPTLKHYAIIVDLYGRAGQLESALRFIESMPISPDFAVWGALFCACRAHRNIQMAELVSQKLKELEQKHPGNYIFLSNVYACVGRWKDVERVRTQMLDMKVEKQPGWSYIEVNGQIHSFVAGDKGHPNVEEIYTKVEEIVTGARERGYKESRSFRLSTPSMYSQSLHQAPARINSKLGIGDFDGTAIFPWTSLPRRTYASSLVMRVHIVQAGLCKN
ncbi:hypothetical protein SAY86_004973 [Trapa natans]|uniref:Pentatricopeptide repeat-containing protein n=1 Tax=Trapa natans TaxID=22666 RepID=A0AAN7QUG2_TRANT|nr:hypothetical protein SAY86_004973 [Trapa natans]